MNTLYLLLEKMIDLDVKNITRGIEAVEPLQTPVSARVFASNPGSPLEARLKFEQHEIILELENRKLAPELLERTIQSSWWHPRQRERLMQHAAFVRCTYSGNHHDAREQMITLYKTAYAFFGQGLLGVVDELAWNCLPRDFVADMMDMDTLQSSRQMVLLGLWTGFVGRKCPEQDRMWFCSKGHSRFGVIDFAAYGQPDEASDMFALFSSLFNYVQSSRAVLQPGDELTLTNGQRLMMQPVTESFDLLDASGRTLMVERLPAVHRL